MFESEKQNPNIREREKSFEAVFDFKTIPSDKHSDRNEDAVLIMKNEKIFGVLDGMGGHRAGDEASSKARDYIEASLGTLPDQISLEDIKKEMENVIVKVDDKLKKFAEKNPALRGMGTTVSLVKILEGKAVVVNAGDSRVYLLRPVLDEIVGIKNVTLEQVTLDDNSISEAIKDEAVARAIQSKLNNALSPEDISEEERVLFESRTYISQAVGLGDIKPRVYVIDIQSGDRLLITSDGVHDNLADKEIEESLIKAPDDTMAVNALVAAALERSRDENHFRKKPDDISAVVIDIK